MSVISEAKEKMKAAVEHLKKEYKNLRTNRVNPNMLDDIQVEVYGSMMNIKSLATCSVRERQINVTPFDPKTCSVIAKGIEQSPLGLQAIAEKDHVRVPVPPLDENLRKDIAKQAKKKTEDAKVVVREIRRKSNELARKQKADGDIAEDEMKRMEKQIQELTDTYCKEMDALLKEKEVDIMAI